MKQRIKNGKIIRKIGDKTRAKLISLVQGRTMKLKAAAKALDIGYENAKKIMQTYRRKGRVNQITQANRVRSKRKAKPANKMDSAQPKSKTVLRIT